MWCAVVVRCGVSCWVVLRGSQRRVVPISSHTACKPGVLSPSKQYLLACDALVPGPGCALHRLLLVRSITCATHDTAHIKDERNDLERKNCASGLRSTWPLAGSAKQASSAAKEAPAHQRRNPHGAPATQRFKLDCKQLAGVGGEITIDSHTHPSPNLLLQSCRFRAHTRPGTGCTSDLNLLDQLAAGGGGGSHIRTLAFMMFAASFLFLLRKLLQFFLFSLRSYVLELLRQFFSFLLCPLIFPLQASLVAQLFTGVGRVHTGGSARLRGRCSSLVGQPHLAVARLSACKQTTSVLSVPCLTHKSATLTMSSLICLLHFESLSKDSNYQVSLLSARGRTCSSILG